MEVLRLMRCVDYPETKDKGNHEEGGGCPGSFPSNLQAVEQILSQRGAD
jgi:hypothetical protein